MRKVVSAMMLSFLCLGNCLAQVREDLDSLDDKLAQYIQTRLPGWKHERVEAIQGSAALIQFWSNANRKIKIAILPQRSADETRDRMKDFLRRSKEAKELAGFGDQAYSWGYAGSNVAFRRGRYTVFVNTYAEIDSDPDARTLSREQKGEREKSEMSRWSREFARIVASAIDQL